MIIYFLLLVHLADTTFSYFFTSVYVMALVHLDPSTSSTTAKVYVYFDIFWFLVVSNPDHEGILCPTLHRCIQL